MKHETNLSTEPEKAKAETGFSRSHEDARGPQGAPTPQTRQAQGPFRLNRLSKQVSFHLRSDFLAFRGIENRFVGKFLCIDARPGMQFRFGITVSRKYGTAPQRNRFKRLVREAIRTAWGEMPQNLLLHIVPRQMAKKANMGDIQKELFRFLSSCPKV